MSACLHSLHVVYSFYVYVHTYIYMYIIYKLNVSSCTFSNNIYKYQYMHVPGTTPKNAQ